jgi:hypothetical protein
MFVMGNLLTFGHVCFHCGNWMADDRPITVLVIAGDSGIESGSGRSQPLNLALSIA